MSDQKGILCKCALPSADFDNLWDRIIIPEAQKTRLVAQVLLEFSVRKKIHYGALPLHGLILLTGPPGTGKTTLAKAVASKAASFLKGHKTQFIQVEPHGLTSESLGRSQREMHKFLSETIAEHAAHGPLIVLLDEVETMAVDRAALSLKANPIDVHRATDAVLAGLDHLASQYPQLLFIATSNFEQAVDAAFISRADLIERIEKPTEEACAAILRDTLEILGGEWPALKQLPNHRKFAETVRMAVGLDGRQIRKAVLQACASTKETAMDLELLSIDQLTATLGRAKEASK